MSWYRIDLGDAMLAETRLARIGREARKAFEAAGRPVGWAVYLAHESGDLHCRALVFFSPPAADLARRLGAEHCTRPRLELELLAGEGRRGD